MDIKFPVLLQPRESVYCAVRTETLNTTEVMFRLLKFLIIASSEKNGTKVHSTFLDVVFV
jgi:hypothetical protein